MPIKTLLKTTQIKLLFFAMLLVSAFVDTPMVKAFSPDSLSTLQMASYRCEQAGGQMSSNLDYVSGAFANLDEFVTIGQFASGPNCWCGVIPVHVLEFTSCKRYFIFQILIICLFVSTLTISIFYRKRHQ